VMARENQLYPAPTIGVQYKVNHLLRVAEDIGGKVLANGVRDVLCKMCDPEDLASDSAGPSR
jgi:hypothetical protein